MHRPHHFSVWVEVRPSYCCLIDPDAPGDLERDSVGAGVYPAWRCLLKEEVK